MKFSSIFSSAALALTLSLGAVAPSKAAVIPISVGSGWHTFSFGGVGSGWSNSFTFTLVGSAVFKVTDAFLSGDRFSVDQILPSIAFLGLTSVPGSLGDGIGTDYDGAFADPRWSSGSFVLGPGTYEITGTAVDSPFGGGGAAVQLASGIPEPSTWALMLLGFAGLGYMAMRRRTSAIAAA